MGAKYPQRLQPCRLRHLRHGSSHAPTQNLGCHKTLEILQGLTRAKLLGLPEGLQVNAQLLAFLVEVATLQT
jgi:hypothetical protein